MTYSVSSSFVDESAKKVGTNILRNFYIGTSDYSDRVIQWPKFTRKAQEFTISNLKIQLANNDGALNSFYEKTYSMVTSAYVQFGFDYGGSSEVIDVFTGNFTKISYENERATIHLKDKLYDLTQNIIGDTSSHVNITHILPSDLAWTLCTCYGQLSNVQSTSNPDIDYDSFNSFAEVFSDSNVYVAAHYEGEKVSEALSRIAKITDSTIYGDGDGKIYFKRYSTVDTQSSIITEDETIKLNLDVLSQELINKQVVGWDYSQESNYSTKTVFKVNTTSQNSFGLYENLLEDNTVWYTTSVGALNMAQRRVFRYKKPPKLWGIDTPLVSIIRQLGETVKLVNSFYNITSAEGQRITEINFDTHNSYINLKTDASISFQGFYLDIDSLDSDNRYLL